MVPAYRRYGQLGAEPGWGGSGYVLPVSICLSCSFVQVPLLLAHNSAFRLQSIVAIVGAGSHHCPSVPWSLLRAVACRI